MWQNESVEYPHLSLTVPLSSLSLGGRRVGAVRVAVAAQRPCRASTSHHVACSYLIEHSVQQHSKLDKYTRGQPHLSLPSSLPGALCYTAVCCWNLLVLLRGPTYEKRETRQGSFQNGEACPTSDSNSSCSPVPEWTSPSTAIQHQPVNCNAHGCVCLYCVWNPCTKMRVLHSLGAGVLALAALTHPAEVKFHCGWCACSTGSCGRGHVAAVHFIGCPLSSPLHWCRCKLQAGRICC